MNAVEQFIKDQQIQRKPRSFDEHYRNLSDDQIGPVYSMCALGYTLWFVRELEDGTKLAVLDGDGIVAITDSGELRWRPQIELRKD